MGLTKLLVVNGDLQGRIILEARQTASGGWHQVAYLSGPGAKSFAGMYAEARVRVRGYQGGSADAGIAGEDIGGRFVDLPIPAGNGAGSPVDVSALGQIMTAVAGGAPFDGTVAVELSHDGNEWGQAFRSFPGNGAENQVRQARFARVRRSSAGVGTPVVTLGAETAKSENQTIHFDIGNVGALGVAPTPGTPSATAMAVFGQLNVHKHQQIAAIHTHLIVDGSSGDLTIEVYRRRSGSFTLLGTMTLTSGGGNFARAVAIPSGGNEFLQPGDYLFCQATAGGLIANGGDGLTVDIHFE